MAKIEITLLDTTRCLARHSASGTNLITDVTPEFGGGGTSFSSTDLLGVSLGTCIGSSLAPVAEREGIPLDQITISVEKSLLTKPKRVGKLTVTIKLPSGLTDVQHTKLRNAANTCTVHRTIEGSIEIETRFVI